jgi:hypothetical protein
MGSDQLITLDSLINSINLPDSELPLALPPTHLTRVKYFQKIIEDGVLKPHIHTIHDKQEELLFLMYGGIFYRFSENLDQDKLLAPIAFVFKPSVLSNVYRYFPFDTGMIPKIGQSHIKYLEPIDHYEIRTYGLDEKCVIPRRIVYTIFGSNDKYFDLEPRQDLGLSNVVLSKLDRFFKQDMTRPDVSDGRTVGIDRRRKAIECQFNTEILLNANLLWLGYPQNDFGLARIIDKHFSPDLPKLYPYKCPVEFSIKDIEAELQIKAKEEVYESFLKFESSRKSAP